MNSGFQGNRGCNHPDFYYIRDWNPTCGLCLIREGFMSELPGRLHMHGTLAENGNPQTDPRFLAHQETVLGLVPPKPGQSLREFRRSRARYMTAPGQYPVTSAIHQAMGLQPPIVIPVVRSIEGYSDFQIAEELDTSILNIQERMAKGIRFIMRLVRDGTRKQAINSSRSYRSYSSGSNWVGSQPSGIGS